MTLPAPPARKTRRALDQGVGERLSLGERRPGRRPRPSFAAGSADDLCRRHSGRAGSASKPVRRDRPRAARRRRRPPEKGRRSLATP